MTKSRGRGKLEDSDLKRLHEENKELRKRIRALTSENSRLKKDMHRGRVTEEEPEDEEFEEYKFIKRQEKLTPKNTVKCPACGSHDVEEMKLDIKSSTWIYITCFECNKRSKVPGKK